MPELSPAEQRVVLAMRSLRAFERIEIRYEKDRPGVMAVVVSSTVKEEFRTDG